MKSRTFIILLLALAGLSGLTWFASRPSGSSGRLTTGARLLPDYDPNALGRVELTSGTQSVALVRGETGWTVEARWNYPADFDRLTRLLRDLDRLKVGDVIRGGTESLSDFGLATVTANNATTVPAELRLLDTSGRETAYLVLGQPRMTSDPVGFAIPDSQFARLNDGPVVLVAPYLDEIPRRADDWLDRIILNVDATSITSMQAHLRDGTHYGLRRENGQLVGDGTLAGKSINSYNADQWFRIWQNLTTLSVVDPARDRATLGFDQADTVEARTADGLHLKVQLGQTDEQGARLAQFTVEWEAPPLADNLDGDVRTAAEKEQQAAGEKAMALQKRISPWVYALPINVGQQFVTSPDQLYVAPTNAPAQP